MAATGRNRPPWTSLPMPAIAAKSTSGCLRTDRVSERVAAIKETGHSLGADLGDRLTSETRHSAKIDQIW